MPFSVIVQLDHRVSVRILHPVVPSVQVPDFEGVPAVPLVLAFDHGISVRSRACAAVRGGKCIPDDMLPQVGMGHHSRCVLLRGAEYGRQKEKNRQQRYQQSQYFFHGNAQSSGKMFWGTEKLKNSEQNVSPGSVDPGETELLYFYRGILSFLGNYSLMTPIRKGLVFTFSKTSLVTVTSTLPSALPTPSKTFHSISPSASSGRIPISTMTFWPSA